jgi:septum site-determining protein MinD
MSMFFKAHYQFLRDGMQKIIGIFSGKGGVGKTTCALNIALAIHDMGEKTILIDCDLLNANLGLQLGLYEFPISLYEILDREINILEGVHVHSSGLRFIPASISFNTFQPDLLKLRDMLTSLNYLVLLDAPSGMGDDVISLIKVCDEIMVITNPDMPSVTDAMKIIQVAMDLDRKEIGLIINKVSGKDELRVQDIEKVCKIPVLGAIPDHKEFKKSLHHKTPIVLRKPHTSPSIEFKRIGAGVVGKSYEPPRFLKIRQLFSR